MHYFEIKKISGEGAEPPPHPTLRRLDPTAFLTNRALLFYQWL